MDDDVTVAALLDQGLEPIRRLAGQGAAGRYDGDLHLAYISDGAPVRNGAASPA